MVLDNLKAYRCSADREILGAALLLSSVLWLVTWQQHALDALVFSAPPPDLSNLVRLRLLVRWQLCSLALRGQQLQLAVLVGGGLVLKGAD